MIQKISTLILLSALSLPGFAATQNCDANHGCTFSIPTNTLYTISMIDVKKGSTYSCVKQGMAKLGNVDSAAASAQGISDINFNVKNGFEIDYAFNAKNLHDNTGNLNFTLICGVGDTPCYTNVVCKSRA